MSKHPLRRLFTSLLIGLLSIVMTYGAARGDSYSFSSTATYYDGTYTVVGDSSYRNSTIVEARGILDLGKPTIINNAPGPTNINVYYPITYSFLMGGETLTGTGTMAIRPIGCGALFDCWFQNILITGSGERHHWEATDGAFFHTDGSPYPSVFVNTIVYADPPGRFELYVAGFRTGPNFDAGQQLYSFPNNTMVFNRIQRDPVCSTAKAFPAVLWSPNHQFVPIVVMGVTDPDGDSVTITVTGVTQDEPVDAKGDGNTSPDAVIEAGAALVRAERSGKGNGRVYEVSFKAKDGKGGSCTGKVTVGVPHSMQKGLTAVDDGQIYESTTP